MDVDNDNFYDEIASFLPQPGDYSLEDLEEIIRSTESHLDASFDINTLSNAFDENGSDIASTELCIKGVKEDQHLPNVPTTHEQQTLLPIKNEKDLNLDADTYFKFAAFPSPATSQQSVTFSSPYETPGRTSSPTSMDGDHFNPDDFINFLNDDDIKIENMSSDTIMKLDENCRNTPSPTGSYSSSGGSSTSGVQSDAYSEASMSHQSTISQEGVDDLTEFIKFKNGKWNKNLETEDNSAKHSKQKFNNGFEIVNEEDVLPIPTTDSTTTFVPIAMPVLPVTSTRIVQPVSYVQGTIIPVQTIPVTAINPVVNLKAPIPIRTENNPSTDLKALTQPVTIVNCTNKSTVNASPKVTPPPNAKPKTIYLSSNDFKALMQKINTNGKKITGANDQIPKIIMKTANGKVIAGNKIINVPKSNSTASTVPSTASINKSQTTSTLSLKSQSNQYVSKMVKSSGSSTTAQQPTKVLASHARSAAAVAAARATLGHTKSYRSDYKSLNDDKLLKKQLRMLKNRESASLSRKKKKEYIERLENRINNLEKENYTLKGENSSLRSQLMAFAQTCNCKDGNVSEFILNTLSIDGKTNEAVLNLMNSAKRHLDNCSSMNNKTTTSRTHHVKIAPKPLNADPFISKGFKHRIHSATVKKNVAVLFAMMFMVTWNIGYFQNYLTKSGLEQGIEAGGLKEEPLVQTGRRLLWVPSKDEFQEQINRTKRDIEQANMPPPPLHFLRPVNRTTADKMNGTSAKDKPPIKRLLDTTSTTETTETTYANSTLENMRLARNLHKWIGDNGYLNLTGSGDFVAADFEVVDHFKFGSGSYMDYDIPLQSPIGIKQKRKIILGSQTEGKHIKLNSGESNRNSLGIFKPSISEEYLRLFKGIKRQDDTFYVLSFNMDHILLPASAYNKSSRPKMSLMLPAGDPSHNGDIVLMQIDCEVINTTELEIKSHMIPEKLRPSKYSANVRVNPEDGVANNATSFPTSIRVEKSKDLPVKREESKEKPSGPRTYFMMGPKNQASNSAVNSISKVETVVKRKPNILKLNANDSVIGSGVLNVRNSSLFSRMRETIGSQTNSSIVPVDAKKLI